MSDTGTLDIRWLQSFFEEGSWIPEIAGTGTAGTFTYARQVGRYIRKGSEVTVHGTINISAISVAPTGNMFIKLLPFLSSNVANLEYAVTFGYISNFNYAAAATQLTGSIPAASQTIILYEAFDNAAGLNAPAANFTNVNFYVQFSAVYTTG